MSFFNELKRRNVFRVGIAYVVFAWLLIQVGDIMFEAFGAPAWSMRGLIIALVIGFPLFLIAAWALELTPQGLKWESELDRDRPQAGNSGHQLNNLILVLALVGVAYLLFDKLYLRDALHSAAPTVNARANVTHNHQSIAVLPFENRSRLEEDTYFVDGVHDDLLTNLARIGELKVISRTTVSQFRDTTKSIPDIAAELGVAHIMEGAVQRAGDTVRINVQLIDAATDEHVWAETYDRQLTADNLFSIQSEISNRIANALKASLTPGERQRIAGTPTLNIDAYNAYLKGRQALALNNSDGAGEALAAFREAVELDAGFALAWAGVAHAVDHKFRYSDLNRDEAVTLLEEAAGRALALNDQLAESHLAQDFLISYRDGPWRPERESSLSRAMALSPGLAEAWLRYSEYLQQFDDRLPDALAAVERAAELDPLSKRIRNQQVSILTSLGRPDEAEQQLARLIELDPDFALNYATMSAIQADKGRIAEALLWRRKAQKRDPGNIMFQLREIWFLTSLGMEQEYDGLLARISELDPNSSTEAFAETIINLRQSRLEAALETANSYAEALGPNSFEGFGFRGMVHARRNEPTPALADFRLGLQSGNGNQELDEGGWLRLARNIPERACLLAWVVSEAQDPDLGRRMANTTLDRVYTELPLHRQSQLSLEMAQCHVVAGNPDAALAAIGQAVADRQLIGWWMELNHPLFDAMRLRPEFQEANMEIERFMAEERERFYVMSAEDSQ